MLPAGGRPATSWAHYTTSCNTQSSAPEDGRNNRPKHVELIGIINNPFSLHLVGCLYYVYINDARSSKYQISSTEFIPDTLLGLRTAVARRYEGTTAGLLFIIFVVPCIMLNSEIIPTRCNNCVYSS